jgi:hypothetical protein
LRRDEAWHIRPPFLEREGMAPGWRWR